MRLIRRREFVLATVLSGIAGFVDAVGFVHLGGYFLSFMSGNTTRLAAGIADADGPSAATAGGIVAVFFVGVIVGSVADRLGRSRMTVLWLVCALLTVAAVVTGLGADRGGMFALASGMGAMNAVFQRDGEVTVGLTYMTGTLVKTGQRLVDAFAGGPRWLWVRYAGLWAALGTGALAGAAAYRRIGLDVLWFVPIAVVAVTIVTGIVRRQAW